MGDLLAPRNMALSGLPRGVLHVVFGEWSDSKGMLIVLEEFSIGAENRSDADPNVFD